MNKPHRDTIFLEEAEILSHQPHEGEQFTLRVRLRQRNQDVLGGDKLVATICGDGLSVIQYSIGLVAQLRCRH